MPLPSSAVMFEQFWDGTNLGDPQTVPGETRHQETLAHTHLASSKPTRKPGTHRPLRGWPYTGHTLKIGQDWPNS